MNSRLYLICTCLLYYLSHDLFLVQATEDSYILPLFLMLQLVFPGILEGEPSSLKQAKPIL